MLSKERPSSLWWDMLLTPALGDWDRWIPVSSRLVWSTGLVVGHSGIYSNTASQTNKTRHNEERAGRSGRHIGIPGNFKI